LVKDQSILYLKNDPDPCYGILHDQFFHFFNVERYGDFGIKRLLRKLWINDREIFGKVGLRIRNISVRTDMIGIQIWINFSTFPVLRDKAF